MSDWRDREHYIPADSDDRCCVCASTHEIGIEPRFGYYVCEEHSKLPPVEISRIKHMKEWEGTAEWERYYKW